MDPTLHVYDNRASVSKTRTLDWKQNETARLCHVLADFLQKNIVERMCHRIICIAELDADSNDPFAHELLELFNP